MVASFPSNADSAQLATDGYSEVILLAPESSTSGITVDYLILAGGGGGGGVIDGGGGAGGYRTSWGTGADGSGGNSGGLSALETALSLSSGTSYSITVGQGGEGGLGWDAGAGKIGHKGRSTSISGADITAVTSDGGGGGIGYSYVSSTEKDGGSGGGGAGNGVGGGRAGGSGTTGQGFDGGTSSVDIGSGGGGAGAAGVSATVTTAAGDGGDGLASTITGTSITRAGGGGGGIRDANGTTNGIGGSGGGGDGGVNSVTRLAYGTVTTVAATSGRPQYGGGGGGAGYNATSATISTGGDGGSGIAIFRIPSTVTYSSSQLASDVSSASNCTATYSAATDGSGDHVITFTVATEDPFDGGATTNDGTITWTPTVAPPPTTWTVPEGVDSLSIVAIGPGGGSGGSNGTNAGGGGGGGGLAWINNVVVSEGSTITMLGGTGGAGADSGNASGDSGTAVTVSINVLSAGADYSSVDLNPYNNVIISSDSASGILTVRSGKGTDSDVLSPFGKLESYDGGSLQTKFDIYNNTKNSFDLNFNVQPYVEYDSSVLPLSYPSWSGGAPGGMNDSDAYPNLYVDSNLYENEDTVLGTIDTIDVGSGRLTLFGVFTNDVGTALQATISNSPYLDSNGNSNVGATDPNDVRGYGPSGEAESVQIIVRSRAGDTISSV